MLILEPDTDVPPWGRIFAVLAGVSGRMGGEKTAQLGELVAVRLAESQGDQRTFILAVIVIQESENLFPAIGSKEWAGVRQVKPVYARTCPDVEIPG